MQSVAFNVAFTIPASMSAQEVVCSLAVPSGASVGMMLFNLSLNIGNSTTWALSYGDNPDITVFNSTPNIVNMTEGTGGLFTATSKIFVPVGQTLAVAVYNTDTTGSTGNISAGGVFF